MRRPALTLAQFAQLPARVQALPATMFAGEPAVMGAPLLDDDTLRVFTQAYARTGFEGARNWYRNLHRNWLDTAATVDHVGVPALKVSADRDFFLPPATMRGMQRTCRTSNAIRWPTAATGRSRSNPRRSTRCCSIGSRGGCTADRISAPNQPSPRQCRAEHGVAVGAETAGGGRFQRPFYTGLRFRRRRRRSR